MEPSGVRITEGRRGYLCARAPTPRSLVVRHPPVTVSSSTRCIGLPNYQLSSPIRVPRLQRPSCGSGRFATTLAADDRYWTSIYSVSLPRSCLARLAAPVSGTGGASKVDCPYRRSSRSSWTARLATHLETKARRVGNVRQRHQLGHHGASTGFHLRRPAPRAVPTDYRNRSQSENNECRAITERQRGSVIP